MTLAQLGSLGEFVGAIATVATLAYLALQIRANTRAVQSAAAQAVHENYANWYELLASRGELSQIVVDGLRDYQSLSEADRAQFVSVFMAFLSYSQNAFIKWREGSLSQELWKGWEQLIMNLVGAPGGKDFWAERSYIFGDDFRDYVEEHVMSAAPHPRARPLGAFAIGEASEASSS